MVSEERALFHSLPRLDHGRCGYISIDREEPGHGRSMNEAAQKIRDGMSVTVFPEGSRSPDGSIQPFKKGGFTLAIKSKVPIVPIAIDGSRDIMRRINSPSLREIRMLMIVHRDRELFFKDREVLMKRSGRRSAKTLSYSLKIGAKRNGDRGFHQREVEARDHRNFTDRHGGLSLSKFGLLSPHGSFFLFVQLLSAQGDS